MNIWQDIAARVMAGERLSASDALTLWEQAPLWRLGEMAVAKKRAVSGDKVFYNKNFHIEPTPSSQRESRGVGYVDGAGRGVGASICG